MHNKVDYFKWFMMVIISMGSIVIGYFIGLITNQESIKLKNKITIYEALLSEYESRHKQLLELLYLIEPYLELNQQDEYQEVRERLFLIESEKD